MKNPIRIQSVEKPETIIKLGNNTYYYNFDITPIKITTINLDGTSKEVDGYDFVQVHVQGQPNYKDCLAAVINEYISDGEYKDAIDSFNSYQFGMDFKDNSDSDYKEYLNTINRIKNMVKSDFKIQANKSTNPKQADVFNLFKMMINTMSLTDDQALSVMNLYPEWSEFIGKNITKGIKIKYNDKLFKVVQNHLVQEQYPPSIDTASLYVEIIENHAGTQDDPIPYPEDGNMIIYNGKYYIEDEIVYLCIRDSEQPLYTKLANLINNYVQKV